MDIIFNKLYRIDVHSQSLEEIELGDALNDLRNYITQLIEDVSEDGNRREFLFPRDATEVKNLIIKAVQTTEYSDTSLQIAQRLQGKEIDAQSFMKSRNLGIDIPKGMLIFSMIQLTPEVKRYFISKAEYTEFIDDTTFQKRQGPPVKKKIYKAFSVDIHPDLSMQNVAILDTNTTLAKYWWKEFLELEEVRSDDVNTQNAFTAIDTKILTPLKSKHPQDYITLRNSIVRYFRSKEEFQMDDFIENGIGDNYEPFDPSLNIEDLKIKIREAATKFKFDNRFGIVQKHIKAKIIKDIQLTSQIELRLKDSIPNIENAIYRKIINGRHYVLVKADSGYELFPEFVEQINGADPN